MDYSALVSELVAPMLLLTGGVGFLAWPISKILKRQVSAEDIQAVVTMSAFGILMIGFGAAEAHAIIELGETMPADSSLNP